MPARNRSHDHIVHCINEFCTTDLEPQLVLELVPFGSLKDQHEVSPVTLNEVFQILRQALSALRYLHERDEPIVHRDIKPGNILVQSRSPYLHIKLSDFGLSRASPDYLKTWCGTSSYAAPEVIERENYDKAVDIWSLGVVVYEYAHGLPNRNYWLCDGSPWIERVLQELEAATDFWGCPLLDFLSTAMLVYDRVSRYSARRCWDMLKRLDWSQVSCPVVENKVGVGYYYNGNWICG
ncbi:hypothetical protein VTJ49DRAFT_5488 [Mycothermus thermophilus]|uniref:Protein kinase domain-containing protein n=1 Tax=Humicola insolens TaxID=85995 RepID=A0ABR3V3J4_HUMIN